MLIEGKTSNPRNAQTINLKNRMVHKKKFPNGGRSADKERQLLIRTKVKLLNGTSQKLDVLIDTGAEANLVKRVLIQDQLFYPAQNPLRFEAANGEVLAGVSQCTRSKMQMQLERNEKVQPEMVEYEIEFFDACIKVDAIL